jgi:competence ComEA-like helix-hairpin-helix protein
MTLTHDEQRALGFIAALLFLSAAIRVANLPDRAPVPGEALDLDAHIAATARAVAAAERMAEPLAPGERLDPNTAPETELARLPRVGPALARRIIEDRERNGPFHSAADLRRVPGVGERLVELATPHLDSAGDGAGRGRVARRARPTRRPDRRVALPGGGVARRRPERGGRGGAGGAARGGTGAGGADRGVPGLGGRVQVARGAAGGAGDRGGDTGAAAAPAAGDPLSFPRRKRMISRHLTVRASRL